MANSKISALTSASTPLAGTETLPIVQSGATVKIPTNDLTVRNIRAAATTGILQVAGPTAGTTRTATVPDANWTAARTDAAQSFTGDQTLSTGNLVQGTAGKGINFTANTPVGGMTSQLLNWYEEGDWTPTDASGAGLSFTISSAKYTREGRKVTCMCSMSYPVTTSGTGAAIAGLPFAAGNNSGGSIQGFFALRNFTITSNGLYGGPGTTVNIDKNNGTNIASNGDLSGATMFFTLIYFT
jgi:hypothetical protein